MKFRYIIICFIIYIHKFISATHGGLAKNEVSSNYVDEDTNLDEEYYLNEKDGAELNTMKSLKEYHLNNSLVGLKYNLNDVGENPKTISKRNHFNECSDNIHDKRTFSNFGVHNSLGDVVRGHGLDVNLRENENSLSYRHGSKSNNNTKKIFTNATSNKELKIFAPRRFRITTTGSKSANRINISTISWKELRILLKTKDKKITNRYIISKNISTHLVSKYTSKRSFTKNSTKRYSGQKNEKGFTRISGNKEYLKSFVNNVTQKINSNSHKYSIDHISSKPSSHKTTRLYSKTRVTVNFKSKKLKSNYSIKSRKMWMNISSMAKIVILPAVTNLTSIRRNKDIIDNSSSTKPEIALNPGTIDEPSKNLRTSQSSGSSDTIKIRSLFEPEVSKTDITTGPRSSQLKSTGQLVNFLTTCRAETITICDAIDTKKCEVTETTTGITTTESQQPKIESSSSLGRETPAVTTQCVTKTESPTTIKSTTVAVESTLGCITQKVGISKTNSSDNFLSTMEASTASLVSDNSIQTTSLSSVGELITTEKLSKAKSQTPSYESLSIVSDTTTDKSITNAEDLGSKETATTDNQPNDSLVKMGKSTASEALTESSSLANVLVIIETINKVSTTPMHTTIIELFPNLLKTDEETGTNFWTKAGTSTTIPTRKTTSHHDSPIKINRATVIIKFSNSIPAEIEVVNSTESIEGMSRSSSVLDENISKKTPLVPLILKTAILELYKKDGIKRFESLDNKCKKPLLDKKNVFHSDVQNLVTPSQKLPENVNFLNVNKDINDLKRNISDLMPRLAQGKSIKVLRLNWNGTNKKIDNTFSEVGKIIKDKILIENFKNIVNQFGDIKNKSLNLKSKGQFILRKPVQNKRVEGRIGLNVNNRTMYSYFNDIDIKSKYPETAQQFKYVFKIDAPSTLQLSNELKVFPHVQKSKDIDTYIFKLKSAGKTELADHKVASTKDNFRVDLNQYGVTNLKKHPEFTHTIKPVGSQVREIDGSNWTSETNNGSFIHKSPQGKQTLIFFNLSEKAKNYNKKPARLNTKAKRLSTPTHENLETETLSTPDYENLVPKMLSTPDYNSSLSRTSNVPEFNTLYVQNLLKEVSRFKKKDSKTDFDESFDPCNITSMASPATYKKTSMSAIPFYTPISYKISDFTNDFSTKRSQIQFHRTKPKTQPNRFCQKTTADQISSGQNLWNTNKITDEPGSSKNDTFNTTSLEDDKLDDFYEDLSSLESIYTTEKFDQHPLDRSSTTTNKFETNKSITYFDDDEPDATSDTNFTTSNVDLLPTIENYYTNVTYYEDNNSTTQIPSTLEGLSDMNSNIGKNESNNPNTFIETRNGFKISTIAPIFNDQEYEINQTVASNSTGMINLDNLSKNSVNSLRALDDLSTNETRPVFISVSKQNFYELSPTKRYDWSILNPTHSGIHPSTKRNPQGDKSKLRNFLEKIAINFTETPRTFSPTNYKAQHDWTFQDYFLEEPATNLTDSGYFPSEVRKAQPSNISHRYFLLNETPKDEVLKIAEHVFDFMFGGKNIISEEKDIVLPRSGKTKKQLLKQLSLTDSVATSIATGDPKTVLDYGKKQPNRKKEIIVRLKGPDSAMFQSLPKVVEIVGGEKYLNKVFGESRNPGPVKEILVNLRIADMINVNGSLKCLYAENN